MAITIMATAIITMIMVPIIMDMTTIMTIPTAIITIMARTGRWITVRAKRAGPCRA